VVGLLRLPVVFTSGRLLKRPGRRGQSHDTELRHVIKIAALPEMDYLSWDTHCRVCRTWDRVERTARGLVS